MLTLTGELPKLAQRFGFLFYFMRFDSVSYIVFFVLFSTQFESFLEISIFVWVNHCNLLNFLNFLIEFWLLYRIFLCKRVNEKIGQANLSIVWTKQINFNLVWWLRSFTLNPIDKYAYIFLIYCLCFWLWISNLKHIYCFAVDRRIIIFGVSEYDPYFGCVVVDWVSNALHMSKRCMMHLGC